MVIFNGWGYQGFDPSLDRASPLGGEIANTRAARARALHAAAALTGPPGCYRVARGWNDPLENCPDAKICQRQIIKRLKPGWWNKNWQGLLRKRSKKQVQWSTHQGPRGPRGPCRVFFVAMPGACAQWQPSDHVQSPGRLDRSLDCHFVIVLGQFFKGKPISIRKKG